MNEKYIGPYPIREAEKMLIHLQDQSGKFINGGKSYIGTFSNSYGYGKKIGLISPDFTIRTRIDYDDKKGAHFNYEDYSDKNRPLKISIGISGFSYDDYKRYIDGMNKGYENSDVRRRFRDRSNDSMIGILGETKMDPKHFRRQHKSYGDPYDDEATLEAKGRGKAA